MADAPRTDHDAASSAGELPQGLLAELAAPTGGRIRRDEVDRARRHAAARTFDDGEVVEEIATQLLALSVR
jgi:hypothetical protein